MYIKVGALAPFIVKHGKRHSGYHSSVSFCIFLGHHPTAIANLAHLIASWIFFVLSVLVRLTFKSAWLIILLLLYLDDISSLDNRNRVNHLKPADNLTISTPHRSSYSPYDLLILASHMDHSTAQIQIFLPLQSLVRREFHKGVTYEIAWIPLSRDQESTIHGLVLLKRYPPACWDKWS